MLLLTNRTLKRVVIDRDAIWIGHLWLLWVIWGHVVTLTRLTDTGPFSSSPTAPALDDPAAPPTRPVL